MQSCDALSERKRYGRASLCERVRKSVGYADHHASGVTFPYALFADFRYCVARAEKIGEPPIIPKFFGVSFLWLIEPPVARQKKSIGFMPIFATHISHIFDT